MGQDLVLGACGTIGRWFDDDNVVGVDREVPEEIEGKFIMANLMDDQDLQFLFKDKDYDRLFQFAADSGGIDYLLSSGHFFGDSTLINIKIIKAIKKFHPAEKVIWPSSYYRYDLYNAYGLEKKYNEELFKRNLPNTTFLIIPVLWPTYGPLCDLTIRNEKVTSMVCRMAILARDGDILQLKLNPDDGRYFIYIEDAVKGIKKMADLDANIMLDIGGMEFITFDRLVKDVIKISNKNLRVEFTHTKRIDRSYPTMKSTLATLDWNPETSFYDGMVITYRWIAERMEAWDALRQAEYL
jgi:nucleoside-diphosphate-sugar epimerase